MGQHQQSLDRNSVRAGFFAVASLTIRTHFCAVLPKRMVFLHGEFFSSLHGKIMIIAHDCVDRDAMGVAPLTLTTDSRALRILVIIDEYTRECLSMYVARSIKHQDVLEQLYELFLVRGISEYIRSDNAPEFTAKAIRKWLSNLGVGTLYIEPGSPWENGYVESFIDKLRDELLNGEIFDTLLEAGVLTERWRREYNRYRPHSALGYKPPAPEAFEVENFFMKVVH